MKRAPPILQSEFHGVLRIGPKYSSYSFHLQLPSTFMSLVENSKGNLGQKKAPITVRLLILSKWILFVVQLGSFKLYKLKCANKIQEN